MATFQEQLARAKKITRSNLSNDLYKFIRSIEEEFLNKNRQQIQEESKDIFGKPIGFYSKATELITGGRKKAGDPYDGYDTGDWLKGFKMQEVSGVLRFTSTDPKTQDILKNENWLSDELFGLSDEDLKEVIQTRLLPFFIEISRQKLGI